MVVPVVCRVERRSTERPWKFVIFSCSINIRV